MAVDSRSESTELAGPRAMKNRHVAETLSRAAARRAVLLLSLIVVGNCSLGGVARASGINAPEIAAQAGQCQDLAIANGLATADPAAASAAHARAAAGDIVAQGLLVSQEFSDYLDSHAWESRAGSEKAKKLSDDLIAAATQGYAGASLIYYRIVQTDYYRDELAAVKVYSRIEARNRALAVSKGAKLVSQVMRLQLRADLQAASKSNDTTWLSGGKLIRRLKALASDPCGSLHATDLGVAYLLGIGVSPDLDTAVAWFQRAAKAGVVVAEYDEATALLQTHARCDQQSQVSQLLTDAAFKGYVNAWVLLGRLRDDGTCGATDPDSAEQYYEEAARRGSVDGSYLLGLLLVREVYDPVRWARGIALLSQSTAAIPSAIWALSGTEHLYAALCGNNGDLPGSVRSRLLHDAAELGITPVFPAGVAQHIASPAACSLARYPIAAGLGPLYGQVMKGWISGAGG